MLNFKFPDEVNIIFDTLSEKGYEGWLAGGCDPPGRTHPCAHLHGSLRGSLQGRGRKHKLRGICSCLIGSMYSPERASLCIGNAVKTVGDERVAISPSCS